MADVKPFAPAKLIIGIISSQDDIFAGTEEAVAAIYGRIDLKSVAFPFDQTDYYDKQMGKGLRRLFLSCLRLVPPESLSDVKVRTNALDEEIKKSFARESDRKSVV